MQKGTRKIDGRYFLLAGRHTSKEAAHAEAAYLRTRGYIVRVIKLWECDWMIYTFPQDSK